MARTSQPTRLKEMAGNPGKRPLNKNEPKSKGILTQPKTLSPVATTLWKKLVGAMPPGLYQTVDEGVLAAYCEAYARHIEMTAILTKDGVMSTGATGQPVIHPALKQQSDQARLMVTLSAKLGFDPVSRANLHADDEANDLDDPFAGLMN